MAFDTAQLFDDALITDTVSAVTASDYKRELPYIKSFSTTAGLFDDSLITDTISPATSSYWTAIPWVNRYDTEAGLFDDSLVIDNVYPVTGNTWTQPLWYRAFIEASLFPDIAANLYNDVSAGRFTAVGVIDLLNEQPLSIFINAIRSIVAIKQESGEAYVLGYENNYTNSRLSIIKAFTSRTMQDNILELS
jgi:hypothetical protein